MNDLSIPDYDDGDAFCKLSEILTVVANNGLNYQLEEMQISTETGRIPYY